MNRQEVINRTLDRMKPEVRNSLTPEQLAEVKRVIASAIPVPSKKLFNFNISIPFLFARYYVAIIIGRDRRKKRLDVPVERRARSSFSLARKKGTRLEDLVAASVTKRRWVPAWVRITAFALMRNPVVSSTVRVFHFVLDVVAVVCVLSCLILMAVAFACFVIYSVKTTFGIDLFPGRHFRDVFLQILS